MPIVESNAKEMNAVEKNNLERSLDIFIEHYWKNIMDVLSALGIFPGNFSTLGWLSAFLPFHVRLNREFRLFHVIPFHGITATPCNSSTLSFFRLLHAAKRLEQWLRIISRPESILKPSFRMWSCHFEDKFLIKKATKQFVKRKYYAAANDKWRKVLLWECIRRKTSSKTMCLSATFHRSTKIWQQPNFSTCVYSCLFTCVFLQTCWSNILPLISHHRERIFF